MRLGYGAFEQRRFGANVLHLISIVLLENSFSELRAAQLPIELLIPEIPEPSVNHDGIPTEHERVGRHRVRKCIGAFLGQAIDNYVDVAFEPHVGFDFGVDGQVAETQNLFLVLAVLVPGFQELVRLLDVQLVLQEAFHPKNMVVLPLQLQLVADQERQLSLGFEFQLVQGFLEQRVQLLFDMGRFRVDFFYFQVDLRQIFGQLVLPALYVWVDFPDFGRDVVIGFLELCEGVLRHLSRGVIAVDLAVDAQGLCTGFAVELQLDAIVGVAVPEFLGFLRDRNPLVLGGEFGSMVVDVAVIAEMSLLDGAVELGRIWGQFEAILAGRMLALHFMVGVDNEVYEEAGVDLIILENQVLVHEDLRVLFLLVQVDRFEAFWAFDLVAVVLLQRVAVRLPHRDLVQQERELLLRLHVQLSVVPDVEYHPSLWNLKPLLAYLLQLVRP